MGFQQSWTAMFTIATVMPRCDIPSHSNRNCLSFTITYQATDEKQNNTDEINSLPYNNHHVSADKQHVHYPGYRIVAYLVIMCYNTLKNLRQYLQKPRQVLVYQCIILTTYSFGTF